MLIGAQRKETTYRYTDRHTYVTATPYKGFSVTVFSYAYKRKYKFMDKSAKSNLTIRDL